MPRKRVAAAPYKAWTVPKLKAELANRGIVLHGGETQATLGTLWENTEPLHSGPLTRGMSTKSSRNDIAAAETIVNSVDTTVTFGNNQDKFSDQFFNEQPFNIFSTITT